MADQISVRPTDDQVCEAMRTLEDAIGVLRCSRPEPEDLARLLAAMAVIPEATRRSTFQPFSPYQLAIAIEDTKQVMREIERTPPAPRPSRFAFLKLRRPAPRYRILPGGPPTTRLGALVARLRHGRTVGTAPTVVTMGSSRFGKGTPASVIPTLIEAARRDQGGNT